MASIRFLENGEEQPLINFLPLQSEPTEVVQSSVSYPGALLSVSLG